MIICLERGASNLHMVQLIFFFIKIQIALSFLVLNYRVCLGNEAVCLINDVWIQHSLACIHFLNYCKTVWNFCQRLPCIHICSLFQNYCDFFTFLFLFSWLRPLYWAAKVSEFFLCMLRCSVCNCLWHCGLCANMMDHDVMDLRYRQVDTAFYPSRDSRMSTSRRVVMLCGWGLKAGMACLQVKLCVAISERFGRLYSI